MHKRIRTTAGALVLASLFAGCDDYLEGPELTTDPNRPSAASIEQLYHGVQITQFVWHTGDLARTAAMWTQQLAGTDRQYQAVDLYDVTEDDFSFQFSGIYIGGGLVDMRQVQRLAGERNDRTYAGTARVWEAFLIGMAASMWGDIPYSEAVGENPTPSLDPQEQVYAQVQALLDQAIADLQSGQGAGPGALDFVYGGNRQRWIQAANTLKARYYMHWVEAQAAGGQAAGWASTACGGNCLERARATAQNGISSAAGDFRTFHTANPGEQNIWYQFMVNFRPGYLSASEHLVGLLRSRNDPRLAEYFAPVGGAFQGSPPGGDPASSVSATRLNPAFRQPLITHQENQLILAEANARLGGAGAALASLNNARAAAGLPGLAGLSGAALLREIAIEKHIAMFQNIEAWNDMKRTCTPALTPASGDLLPGRLFYGAAERNTNPNVPAPGEVTDRNRNDPRAC
jgi:starch-binding outer membrane protein, SusD/RagB family